MSGASFFLHFYIERNFWQKAAFKTVEKERDMRPSQSIRVMRREDEEFGELSPEDAGVRPDDVGAFMERASCAAACSDADTLLMEDVAKGSEQAFRILVQKWKNPLMNYFYRSVSDSHTAEDLAQQTFINLYRARRSYSAKAKFSTYLFFIARRLLINEYRRRTRKPVEIVDPFEMEAPAQPSSELAMSEIEEFFYKTLELMPENQRTAILLLKQQELSYDEIAKVMGVGVSAVKTWIHRARETLRKALADRRWER